MLYKRNYHSLTIEEKQELLIAKKYLVENQREIGTPVTVSLKYHELLPNAYYHFNSLFPNNYLDIGTLKDEQKLKIIETEFLELLNSEITERQILNFINTDENFNLIASIFHSGYDFGHHNAFLFKEFELTSTYRADYLLVGKNSGGYNFIFVELENPNGQITKNDGEFGTTLRKGIKQVEDWDSWIEGNYSSLKLIFDKHKKVDENLPKEFLTLDKSRINYVVIAGRRENFNDKTYELKRKYLKRNNIKILHYDNLIDSFRFLKISGNY
tara:strand:- start:88 stop:897 length:810 start_codon:yes stop_codon:yes gene_type:complete